MQNLKEIKGVGPKTISLLKKLNINNIDDLVHFYPFRYEEFKLSNIKSLNEGDKIIIDGVIENIPNVFYFNRRMDKMSFRINTGEVIINVVIFNRGFLKPKLTINKPVTIVGKFDKKYNNIVASDIRFGLLEEKTIEPIYRSTYGLTGNKIKDFINLALPNYTPPKIIPNNIQKKYKFIDKKEALDIIHNPTELKILDKIRWQLKYEELFLFMLQMNFLKINKNNHNGIDRNVDFSLVNKFINNLPFKLTKDQFKSAQDIYHDLNSPKRMNRLLQGDVGSGKTIVAVISMYINYLSNYTSALMVPTEVLANQHYKSISKILKPYNIKVALLTGKLKAKDKKEIQNKINNGEVDIVIGTHAIITNNVEYPNLGLVITDEQHRFGVNQRSIFKNKGISPDILYMSATPIPRTYALTLYGDMDISNIKTMPVGRKPIKTYLKSESDIKETLEMIYKELLKGHQVYVIVPLIEESDKLDALWIEQVETKYKAAFGGKYKIESIHGKMTSEEKDVIMNNFKNGKTQILISTTVIEVGVDVPNATMMVIYDSYRFGLSTLHQLRGRVGRGVDQSYCILISNKETKRLLVLTRTNDGFAISEEDFKLRGSGDIFGIRQSGDMSFSIANIKEDYNIILQAKKDSLEYLNNNPNIEQIECEYLKQVLYNSIDLG